MFNEKLKDATLQEMEKENQRYIDVFSKTIKSMERLQHSRESAVRLILDIERYIKSLANKPREFENQIKDINFRYTDFNKRIALIKELDKKNQDNPYDRTIRTTTLLGVGGASLAPSAAMAIAMTFGTASTGTAIASLSGVATTNAALAWLGGGALTAGGIGVAGGQALHTMAGPIGWAVGGISVTGGVLLKSFQNKDIAKKAEEATVAIKKEKERISEVNVKVCEWNKETLKLTTELRKKLCSLRFYRNYTLLSDTDKKELIIMMNMTELLSKKIGEKINE